MTAPTETCSFGGAIFTGMSRDPNNNPDSLFFLPPPFPGRANEPFPVETAALQLHDFEHTFATPLGEPQDAPSRTMDAPQQKGALTLSSLVPLGAPTVSEVAVHHDSLKSSNNPLATLAAASPDPNAVSTAASQSNHEDMSPKKRGAITSRTDKPNKKARLTPSEENELLKQQLAQREQEIQLLKQQLIKTTAATGKTNQNLPVADNTASLVGDAVLAFASAEHPVDPNMIRNLQERWRARFQQLVRYKLRYGHCNVSKADDAPLHAWVRKQRTNKQLRDKTNGSKGLMREQVDALESIGFEWVVGVGKRPHIRDDQWQANFEKLMQYRNEYGSLPISIPADKALTKWMQNQRARKKLLQELGPSKAKGMTWERVQKLELLGFKWTSKDRL